MPSGTRNEYSVLDRGSACLQCKRRKKRCDGTRPVCGPCVRFGTTDGCEYPKPQPPRTKPKTSPPRSKSEILKQQIRDLEDQLSGLQRVVDGQGDAQASSSRSGRGATVPGSSSSLGRTVDPSHSGSSSDGAEGEDEDAEGEAMDEDVEGTYSPSHPSPNPFLDGASSTDPTISREVTDELLRIFLQNRHRCACEIDPTRFQNEFHHQFLSGHPDSPSSMHPGLVKAALLIGCHFARLAQDTRFLQYESALLSQTRDSLAKSLTAADRLIDFLRGTALLVWYYFAKGRIAEAQYHASGVACFASACRLNLIDPIERDLTLIISAPKDDIDLEERISLFWTIFTLDRYASLMCTTATTIRDGNTWTPWPRPLEEWESPRQDESERRPVQPFTYLPALDMFPLAHCALTYRSLGIMVLERSTRLSNHSDDDDVFTRRRKYEGDGNQRAYLSIREIVRRLSTWLPALPSQTASPLPGGFYPSTDASGSYIYHGHGLPPSSPVSSQFGASVNIASASSSSSSSAQSPAVQSLHPVPAQIYAQTHLPSFASGARSSSDLLAAPGRPFEHGYGSAGSIAGSMDASLVSSGSRRPHASSPLRTSSSGGSASDSGRHTSAVSHPSKVAALVFAHSAVSGAWIRIHRALEDGSISTDLMASQQSLQSPSSQPGAGAPFGDPRGSVFPPPTSTHSQSSLGSPSSGGSRGPLPISVKVSSIPAHLESQRSPTWPPSSHGFAQQQSWAGSSWSAGQNTTPPSFPRSHSLPVGNISPPVSDTRVSSVDAAARIADLASFALTTPGVFDELDMMMGMIWSLACSVLSVEIDRIAMEQQYSGQPSGVSPSGSHSSGGDVSAHDLRSHSIHGVPAPFSYVSGGTFPRVDQNVYGSGSTPSAHSVAGLTHQREVLLRALERLSPMFQLVGIMRSSF